MQKRYRIHIHEMTPGGGTGKLHETQFADGPIGVQEIAKQYKEAGYAVPAIERWSDLNEDYVISIAQTELMLGRRISDENPTGF